ncbi:MAG: indolepyruvate ferredoxin oxidoreductase subunit alpha [Anaerolineales bacterium]
MAVTVNQAKCTGCGSCLDTCPMEAIQIINGKAQIDSALCRECEVCINICPTGALTVASPQMLPVKHPPMEIIQPKPVEKAMVKDDAKPRLPSWMGVITAILSSELIPQIAELVNQVRSSREKSVNLQPKFTSNNSPLFGFYGGQRRMRRRFQNRGKRYSNFNG